MNIGLTGGIASGKSTVASYMQSQGAFLIDADVIAREIVAPNSPVLERIRERFGQAVIDGNGALKRKELATIIFADREARRDLEAIMHPVIRAEMRSRMQKIEEEYPGRLVVVDVPLLFESGLQSMFNKVMLVYVRPEMQLQRLMERDGITELQARERLAAQMAIDEKKKLADVVIDNGMNWEQTKQQIDRFMQGKGFA